MGMVPCCRKLQMKVILYKAPEVRLILPRGYIFPHFPGLICPEIPFVRFPTGEVGSPEIIPQHTISRIRLKPGGILFNEFTVCLRGRHPFPCLLESLAQKPELFPVHLLVIHLRKDIQFIPQTQILLILNDTRIRKMDELRMEGKAGIGIVRV